MTHQYRFPQPNNQYYYEPLTLSSQLLVDEAIKQGMTVEIPEGTRLVVFSKGDKSVTMQAQTPEKTSFIGFYASEDKGVCRALLQQAGLQVPKGYTLRAGQSQEEWLAIYDALRKPLVIKPTHGTQGRLVFLNITTKEDFLKIVADCFQQVTAEGAGVVIEEQFIGNEYRIVATREKVLAIMRRIPANIIGDGTHTIAELIEQKNSDPRRSDSPMDALVKIKITDEVLRHLEGQSLTLSTIPAKDECVFLRANSNISTGGDSIDATDMAHESVKKLAVEAVRTIPGLAFAGVDFITTDITAEQNAQSYAVIELNKSPGFSIHEFPFEGKPRQISAALLELLFS